MKRFMTFLLMIALTMFFVGPPPALAAGTVTTTYEQDSDMVWKLTYTCTADASDGSFPATASEYVYGYIVRVVTDPSAVTTPTDEFDITLTDSNGCPVMGGMLEDRDTSEDAEQEVPKISGVKGGVYVSGPLTITITNNSVNSAVVVVVVYIELPRF